MVYSLLSERTVNSHYQNTIIMVKWVQERIINNTLKQLNHHQMQEHKLVLIHQCKGRPQANSFNASGSKQADFCEVAVHFFGSHLKGQRVPKGGRRGLLTDTAVPLFAPRRPCSIAGPPATTTRATRDGSALCSQLLLPAAGCEAARSSHYQTPQASSSPHHENFNKTGASTFN